MTVTLRHETPVPVDVGSVLVFVLCAVGVGLLTRRRPAFGVAALLVLAPFDLARYIGPTTMTTLKAGLIGLFAALAFGRPDLAALRTLPVRAVLVAFGVLLAGIALSASRAEYLGAVAREALKNVEYLVLFLAAAIAYATDPDDRPFWRAYEVVVVLVALSALAEYATGARNGIFLHGRAFPRIAGALEGPNQLAGYLGIALPVLVSRALVHRDRVLAAVIALAAVVDLLTFSRAGLLGAAAGIAVVVFILRPPSRAALVGGAVVVVALGAVLVAVALQAGVPAGYFGLDQATQSGDHLANRALLWHAAIALWQSSPLVGVGAGNYELELARVGLENVRTHANSLYLQSLAEGGMVGLLATLVMFATTIVVLARAGLRRPLVVGALGATIAMAVHQVGDDMFFFPKVASAYWLVTGVGIAEIAARRLFEQRRAATFAVQPAR